MKRIAIYTAMPDMILAKEIYSRNGRLLLGKGTALTEEWIDKLVEFGIPRLYVVGDSPEDESIVEETRSITAQSGSKRMYTGEVPDMISQKEREEAERIVQDIMFDVKKGLPVKTSEVYKIVEKIIGHLINVKHIVGKLADIRILDDYTFAHSVNVCMMSLSTGIIMGYSKLRLRELGLGAILHDVGKVKIPDEIINKCGPLTEKEFAEIKRHTILGYEMLNDHPEITPNAAKISLQHHECYNGTGYPNGVKDSDIHEYSRIVALADVYDALTADRVYKNAILPYEAMEIIIASSGYQFDPEIVRIFVENSEIYPVGSTVELNTGELGVVVDVNRTLPTRPTVQLVTDFEENTINNGAEINLMTSPTVFVNRILTLRKRFSR